MIGILIIYIISLILYYLIFFCFKEQKLTWVENKKEWKITKRIKFPLWFWIIGTIVLITPILNITGLVIFSMILHINYNADSDWDYKYRFHNKLISILNKKY